MKQLTLYLDTSIINFLFADDAPEKRDITQEFFREYVKKGRYGVYISPIVIDEINKTNNDMQRIRLLNVIKEYSLPTLDITPSIAEIQHLAQRYIDQGIIPRKKLEDALHIAICTVNEMDVLLSWNFRHLANVSRERKVLGLNIQEGYMKALRIVTPLEVISDEIE
jgi:predicted nucleic acid-binding protein